MPGEPRKPRVLIVDDELQMGETLADALADRGYEAVFAANGAAPLPPYWNWSSRMFQVFSQRARISCENRQVDHARLIMSARQRRHTLRRNWESDFYAVSRATPTNALSAGEAWARFGK